MDGPPAVIPSARSTGYSAVTLERLAAHACGLLGVSQACVFACDPREPEVLIPAACHGLDEELLGSRIRPDGGLFRFLMHSRAPVLVPDPQHLRAPTAQQSIEGLQSAAAPAFFDGSIRGAISVDADGGRAFGLRELELLGELGKLVGAALEHHRRRELTAGDPARAVAGLLRELAAADRATADHSVAVGELARRVGERLGLRGAELIELELGALLHDVGKLCMPPALIARPGPLGAGEWDLMGLHPVWGAEMVAGIAGLEAVAVVVRFHHERVDGNGYPDGMAGERIPLASRVVACCDAYAALSAGRPYRGRGKGRRPLAELRACAGRQFDATVVGALTDVVADSPG